MWLNMGCPRDQRSLRPLPYDYDEDEKRMVGQDLEDALGIITDDEEDRKGADRRIILVQDCKARPELNGKYERSSDLMANGRPVFEKKAEVRNRKGKGKGKHDANEMKRLLMPHMLDDDDITIEVMVIHYKKDHKGINTGWWISKNSPTGPGLAWNGRDTKGPPTGGWFTIRDRQKLPDPVFIIDPKQANDENFVKKRKNEGSRALEQLDGNKLKGKLLTPDKNVMSSEYFGHFCMLMHLEHMEELRQIRRRTETMQDAELQRLGWCLDGLPCIGIFGRRDPKKNTIIGWEDPGSEMGTLQLPPNTQFDRLKFKRGDSVVISESRQQVRVKGEALEKLGEGFIADIQLPRGRDGESKMIIRLRGCWPDDSMARRWRIDKGANSTLYERQLQAMLNLVNKERSRVPELLISAKVGLADSWAKQWRKGQGVTDEDKELAAKAAEQAEKDVLREKETVLGIQSLAMSWRQLGLGAAGGVAIITLSWLWWRQQRPPGPPIHDSPPPTTPSEAPVEDNGTAPSPEDNAAAEASPKASAAEMAEDAAPERTAVVARRMIFAHLGLKLNQEQRQEEREFWKRKSQAKGK
eukprot:symbB.v1.2.035859.t1/scaffold4925.1/size32794/3